MKSRIASGGILSLTIALALIAIPASSFAQVQKGVELYGDGHYKEAEAVFRDTLKKNPSDAPNVYYLGLSVLLQDKYSEALDLFLKVKQLQSGTDQRTHATVPDEYLLNLSMARARLGLKQYDDAWKNLEAARVKHPDSSDVYVYRGVYYYQQEKYPAALKELEKAISLDPKNPHAHYYEGMTYFKKGQPKEAVDSLKMFLQLDPDDPEAEKAREIVKKLC